jgi:hypothetical protein
MKTSVQQSLLVLSSNPTLRSAPYGEIISYNGKYLMRLKPTSFLLNSNLIADVLNRSDCIVCNIETGTVYVMEGDKEVEFVNATMHIVKD